VTGLRHVRVAAVVRAPLAAVRDAVAVLPAAMTGYVVQTGAGVLVTLERRLRWPRSRRRTIKSLQRALKSVVDTVDTVDAAGGTAGVPGRPPA
jgi:hypothetical protein